MTNSMAVAEIQENIKSSFAKYIVFHDTDFYSNEEFKNSLIDGLENVKYNLMEYELFLAQLSKSDQETEYSQICKLVKFYVLLQTKISKIHETNILEIKNKIKEVVSFLKKLQAKVRNEIEGDIKNALSLNNNTTLINFISNENRKIQ